jgi:hypothetical protein
MVTLTLVLIAVLAIVNFLMFGALVELFRDVRQLRDIVGVLDRPLHLGIGRVAGTAPSLYGLPGALDSTNSAVVLFLSDKCSTCRTLAASLEGRSLPLGLWVIVEAATENAAQAFVETLGLNTQQADGRVLVDVDGAIASRIGLDTTPVGFQITNGRVVEATTVPSVRYFQSIVPTPIQLKPALVA